LIVALAVASAAFSPATAQAAFPGQNGKIAFSCDLICTMNPDGSDRAALTTIVGRQPAWSADGGAIAFTSGPFGSGDIYTVKADGSQLA
jgi:hypothetical protein